MGDPTKTQEKLGWQPSVTFEELVKLTRQTYLQLILKRKKQF
ncbi:MAG: hypothetical protein QNJ72_23680 [Pleurocapsa sp. MO_226.B13]|nr:hypothetical protein [Pleurocapsa sp. MO_226.B13]